MRWSTERGRVDDHSCAASSHPVPTHASDARTRAGAGTRRVRVRGHREEAADPGRGADRRGPCANPAGAGRAVLPHAIRLAGPKPEPRVHPHVGDSGTRPRGRGRAVRHDHTGGGGPRAGGRNHQLAAREAGDRRVQAARRAGGERRSAHHHQEFARHEPGDRGVGAVRGVARVRAPVPHAERISGNGRDRLPVHRLDRRGAPRDRVRLHPRGDGHGPAVQAVAVPARVLRPTGHGQPRAPAHALAHLHRPTDHARLAVAAPRSGRVPDREAEVHRLLGAARPRSRRRPRRARCGATGCRPRKHRRRAKRWAAKTLARPTRRCGTDRTSLFVRPRTPPPRRPGATRRSRCARRSPSGAPIRCRPA